MTRSQFHTSRPLQALVDLSAMSHNLAQARRRAGGRPVWAVAKANAYGHGIENAVRAFAEADGLAVLETDEAQRARAAGWRKPILLLEGAFASRDFALVRELDLTVVVHCAEQLSMLEQLPAQPPVRRVPEAGHRNEPPGLCRPAGGTGARPPGRAGARARNGADDAPGQRRHARGPGVGRCAASGADGRRPVCRAAGAGARLARPLERVQLGGAVPARRARDRARAARHQPVRRVSGGGGGGGQSGAARGHASTGAPADDTRTWRPASASATAVCGERRAAAASVWWPAATPTAIRARRQRARPCGPVAGALRWWAGSRWTC